MTSPPTLFQPELFGWVCGPPDPMGRNSRRGPPSAMRGKDGNPPAPGGRDEARWDGVSPPHDPQRARPSLGPAQVADATVEATDVPVASKVVGPAPDGVDGDEARLVARLVAHDEAAFNTLVRTYEKRIFALLVRMIGSRAEAEELAQEVFVQVFKAIGAFRGESKLSTWVYRIAINLCKNRSKYLRTRHTAQQQTLDGFDDTGPASTAGHSVPVDRPDEALAGVQLERIVRSAILALEPSFRECLILRDIEDLSYVEIEAITGLPEGTVKSRIHRARAQLREIVERALGEKIG
jgi:RNA polymerase sigma-70 factor (ECF subfamily)